MTLCFISVDALFSVFGKTYFFFLLSKIIINRKKWFLSWAPNVHISLVASAHFVLTWWNIFPPYTETSNYPLFIYQQEAILTLIGYMSIPKSKTCPCNWALAMWAIFKSSLASMATTQWPQGYNSCRYFTQSNYKEKHITEDNWFPVVDFCCCEYGSRCKILLQ